MAIQGRFIGTTSCGFVSGCTYSISIYTTDNYVVVGDTKSGAMCPYSNIQLLAKNWEIPIKSE